MKLKELWIKGYKNLNNITIDFESGNGLTMLVGNNGSGKSNVLEAISGIFHDAYKVTNQERKLTAENCEYSLSYVLNEKELTIERKQGGLRFYVGSNLVKREVFIRSYMPNNVISVYSGEDERLWISYYESYYKAYIRQIKYNEPIDYMRLMLINKYYWNLALLVLLVSENPTLKPFINKELGIHSVSKITFEFDISNYSKCKNELLKAFIKRINPEYCVSKDYSIEELQKLIFYDNLYNENGELLVDSNGNGLLVNNGNTDLYFFNELVQAFMPKDNKIITTIAIIVNDNISVAQLSEGEKKLILIKTILEIVADEKTLLLFDEPDAHLHEGRKKVLHDIMLQYQNRQIVFSTHSPLMAQLAFDGQLAMLETVDGEAQIIPDGKVQKIKKLVGATWDIVGQNMVFQSDRPLIIFEGKTDVAYVKRALELLRGTRENYQNINVDFINANGAGNAKSFIENLMEIVPIEKRIIMFFDQDDAGKTAAASIVGISKDDERIVKCRDLSINNIIISFIPYRAGIEQGDFLIEDYFSWDGTVKAIVESVIPINKHPIKNLPNLSTRIKNEIERRYLDFSADEFKGFIPLIDKIIDLIGQVEET